MSQRRALVIGGTGPTGPHLVRGLLGRGFDVSILHRGEHEPAGLPEVPHIHSDPHFEEPLREAVGSMEWDLIAAMYGRASVVSKVFAGRCDQYISISGIPVYAGYGEPQLFFPFGMAVGATEVGPLVSDLEVSDADLPVAVRFARKMLAAEATVLSHHPRATVFRYPMIYGPRNLIPWEWSVVRRVLDGREWMVLPNHGMAIYTRCAAENAAHALLLVVDSPALAAGHAFNVADEQQYTHRQWVELVSRAVGRCLRIKSIPSELCLGWSDTVAPQTGDISPHNLVSSRKIRDVLGYQDVVAAQEAISRSARWFLENPVRDGDGGAAFFDTFDYAYEDAAVADYESLCTRYLDSFPSARPMPLHAMPHPVTPGQTDPKGR